MSKKKQGIETYKPPEIEPKRTLVKLNWNQLPSRHKRIAVYKSYSVPIFFKDRDDLITTEVRTKRLFRGSKKAFDIWLNTVGGVPAGTDVIYE